MCIKYKVYPINILKSFFLCSLIAGSLSFILSFIQPRTIELYDINISPVIFKIYIGICLISCFIAYRSLKFKRKIISINPNLLDENI